MKVTARTRFADVLPGELATRHQENACAMGVRNEVPRAFLPGVETWYASDSTRSRYSAVFEDDGDTAYFYAYDRENPSKKILDAVHVYNVANVVDRSRESIAEILWSPDELKALLLINEYPHALIDFGARVTYSRTEYPPGTEQWPHRSWDDERLEEFRDRD